MYKGSVTGDVIIFLDFDGPLLPARMHYEEFNSTVMHEPDQQWHDNFEIKKKIRFDPVMINVLNRWIAETNAKVVISSNWAKWSTLEQICVFLEGNGFKFCDNIHDQWKTPRIPSWTRADEISHWLFNNFGKFSNYMIIDDDDSVMNDQRLDKEKVLLIDFNDGLSFKQIFDGCEILGITEYDKVLTKDYK